MTRQAYRKGNGSYATVIKPETYGAKADGSTDDSTAVQAAIQAAYDAGGGTVVFAAGKTYRINSQLSIPYDNAKTNLPSRYIRLTGGGASRMNSYVLTGADNAAPVGTVLDLRYASTGAKIVALGLGPVEIDHLTLYDGGTSSTPFMLFTGGQPRVHDVVGIGNPSKLNGTCDQDFVVCGGTDATQGTTSLTAAFNGFGGFVRNCGIVRMRRLAFLQNFANGLVIDNNWTDPTCGSTLTPGAIVELNSGAAGSLTTSHVQGNIISNNTFEIHTGYTHAVYLANNARHNGLVGNGYWDPVTSGSGGRYLYDVGCGDTTSVLQNSLIMSGYSLTNSIDPNWLNGTAVNNMIVAPNGIYTPLNLTGGKLTSQSTAVPALQLDHQSGHATDMFQIRNNGSKYVWVDQFGEVFARLNFNSGTFQLGTDTAGAGTNAVFLRAGTGAPSGGNDGDFYFRKDGATGTAIYQRRAGAWVAIL